MVGRGTRGHIRPGRSPVGGGFLNPGGCPFGTRFCQHAAGDPVHGRRTSTCAYGHMGTCGYGRSPWVQESSSDNTLTTLYIRYSPPSSARVWAIGRNTLPPSFFTPAVHRGSSPKLKIFSSMSSAVFPPHRFSCSVFSCRVMRGPTIMKEGEKRQRSSLKEEGEIEQRRVFACLPH